MIQKKKFEYILFNNLSFHSTKKFSNDSSIINYVHSLLVIPLGKGEEFYFSISNDVFGVQISNSLDILEIFQIVGVIHSL